MQPLGILLGENQQTPCGGATGGTLWVRIKEILINVFVSLSEASDEVSPESLSSASVDKNKNIHFPRGKGFMPRMVGADFTVEKSGTVWLHELHWTAEPDSRLLSWMYDAYHGLLETGKMPDPRFQRVLLPSEQRKL